MTNEALLAFAGRHGYYVEYVPLEANQSFTIETQRCCNTPPPQGKQSPSCT